MKAIVFFLLMGLFFASTFRPPTVTGHIERLYAEAVERADAWLTVKAAEARGQR